MADKSILDVAKAQVIAYNDKNWEAAKQALTVDVVYDEVATQRRIKGVEEVLPAWKGWAKAFPDSRASFDKETVSGNTVILELTWRGRHTGPLQMPGKEYPPTGKTIEIRACQVVDVAGSRVQSVRQYFDMATMLKQLGV